MIMSGTLELQRAPLHAQPPHAARADLPYSLAASAQTSREPPAAEAPHVTVNRFLAEQDRPRVARLQGERPADNVMLALPPVAAPP